MSCTGGYLKHRYVCKNCGNQRKMCVRCGSKHPNWPQNMRAGYPMWRHGTFYHLCMCPDNVNPVKRLTPDGKILAAQRERVGKRRMKRYS